MGLSTSRTSRILTTWGKLSYQQPGLTLLVCLLFAAWAGYYALHISIETDILHMLPEDSPAVQDMLSTMEKFQSFDSLYLILTDPAEDEEMRRTRLEEFADLLADQIRESSLIKSISYKRDPDQLTAMLDFFIPRLPRFLTPAEREDLNDRLSAGQLEQQFRRNRLLLLSQPSMEMKELITRDPLGLVNEIREILAPVESLQEFSGIDSSSEYYFHRESDDLLFIIEPSFPAQDVDKSRRLISLIDRTVQRIGEEWDEVPVPLVKSAGGPAIAVSDEAQIKRDMQVTIVTSSLGILLFFVVAFRTFLSPLIVILPLLLGIIDTIGFASLTLGRLNILSSIFAVVLVGLGIDFSIHLIHRFRVARLNNSAEQALDLMCGETGQSVLAGALTTAAAFLALSMTDFRGIKELGLVAGAGIILTFINIFTMVPAFISIYERYKPFREVSRKRLERWAQVEKHIFRNRMSISFSVLFVTLGALAWFIFTGGVPFETDLALMRPEESPIWTTQQEISEKFLWTGEPLLVVTRGNEMSQVLERLSSLEDELIQCRNEGIIKNFLSLSSFFPEHESHDNKLPGLEQLDPKTFRQDFLAAVHTNGFRKELFQPALDNLVTMISSPPPVDIAGLSGAVGTKMIDSLFHREDEKIWTITYLYMDTSRQREENIMTLVNRLDNPSQGVSVTGVQRIIPEFKRIIRTDFVKATAAAAITVLVILFLTIRHPLFVLLALVPLALGVFWTMVVMKTGGLHFNFMNIIVTPLLIGIGIDDGIHIVQFYRHNRNSSRGKGQRSGPGVTNLLAVPGKGIVLTSITTIIGFGSLSLAHYPGLQWIGILTVLGVGFCLFYSLFVLPALIYFFEKGS